MKAGRRAVQGDQRAQTGARGGAGLGGQGTGGRWGWGRESGRWGRDPYGHCRVNRVVGVNE